MICNIFLKSTFFYMKHLFERVLLDFDVTNMTCGGFENI